MSKLPMEVAILFFEIVEESKCSSKESIDQRKDITAVTNQRQVEDRGRRLKESDERLQKSKKIVVLLSCLRVSLAAAITRL